MYMFLLTLWFLLAITLQIRWGHIEDVELINDGSGLGFGIVGGKSSGVVVRTIVPGGLADRVSWPSLISFWFYTIPTDRKSPKFFGIAI